MHYIAEIRNECGSYASHGQDIEHKQISSDLALFVLHSTNAILGFILHFYIATNDYRNSERIRYEDYERINEWINWWGVWNGNNKISYSQVLFAQDPDAYREMVLEFEQIEYERLMDTL